MNLKMGSSKIENLYHYAFWLLSFEVNPQALNKHINAIEKVQTYLNGRLALCTQLLDGDATIVSRYRVNNFKTWLDGKALV